MKTKVLLFFLFIFGGIYSLQAQDEWEWVCSLVGENLCKVSTQGTDTIYVVGENGLIAMSTDKGLTWNKSYFPSKVTLNDILFYSHDIGFIVGNNGTILKTQDAGLSWEQMNSGTLQNINAIAAFDFNNIWIIGNSGLIMYSTDAGETWFTKSFSSDNLNFNDIKSKGSRGYIAGYIDGQGSVVFNTEDGGTSWKEQILAEYDIIPFISIADSKVYVIAGSINSNMIFTEDNINWRSSNIQVGGFPIALYFQDDQNGFVASYDYTTCGDCVIVFWINKTIDGGNTIEQVYSTAFSGGNSTRSNFAFSSNNVFGYCVLGKQLMRSPYTGEFNECKNYNRINLIKSDNPILMFNQQGDELQINSYLKIMDRVELFNISGIKIRQKTDQSKAINLDVNNLPKGVYLINVFFQDETNYFTKWIKK